ncbi:MAG: MerR family transcriptional regulator [Clostridiaceae bacterium]|nr:MerR family transcriptional regulator [Clostridiaceae bacterium]
MNMKNCARCGKLFTHIAGPPLCVKCREEDEKDFKKVKEYLYEHRGATVTEVATDLDIPVARLKRFIKEGRLEVIEDSNLLIQCERCGISIKSGRYCDRCTIELTKELKKAANESVNISKQILDRSERDEKMRYLHKSKIKLED